MKHVHGGLSITTSYGPFVAMTFISVAGCIKLLKDNH